MDRLLALPILTKLGEELPFDRTRFGDGVDGKRGNGVVAVWP